MTMLIEQLAEDMMTLGKTERALLAHRLIESLDDEPDDGTEVEWRQEIDKRCLEIKTGAVVCQPVEDVITNIRANLKNARYYSSKS